MYLIFIRPILEKSIGITTHQDCEKRYQFNEGVIEKITDSKYKILDMDKCCDELIEIYSSLKNLPIFIGDEATCDRFEVAVSNILSDIKNTDILWVEPLKQPLSNFVATVYGHLSNRVILRSGKTYQRVKFIDNSMWGLYARDIRVLNAVTKFDDEELNYKTKIRNYSRYIVNAMLTARQHTIEEIVKHKTSFEEQFNNEENKWICCRVGGAIGIYEDYKSLLDDIIKVSIDNENTVKDIKILCYGNHKYGMGIWSSNTGIFRIVKNYDDVKHFITMFENTDEVIRISIMEDEKHGK